jgi:hypothetical protein
MLKLEILKYLSFVENLFRQCCFLVFLRYFCISLVMELSSWTFLIISVNNSSCVLFWRIYKISFKHYLLSFLHALLIFNLHFGSLKYVFLLLNLALVNQYLITSWILFYFIVFFVLLLNCNIIKFITIKIVIEKGKIVIERELHRAES